MPNYIMQQSEILKKIVIFVKYVYEQSIKNLEKDGKLDWPISNSLKSDMYKQYNQVINLINVGFCHGFGMLYLLSKYLQTKTTPDNQKNINNYDWFIKMLVAIKDWDGKPESLTKSPPGDVISYYEYLESLTSHLKAFQEPGRYFHGNNECFSLHAEELLEYNIDKKIMHGSQVYGAVFYCNASEFERLLKAENFIQANTLVLIGAKKHTTALIMQQKPLKEKIFYHFDPNQFYLEDDGLPDEKEVARKVFACRNFNHASNLFNEKMLIAVKIYSFDPTKKYQLYANLVSQTMPSHETIIDNNIGTMVQGFSVSILENARDSFGYFFKKLLLQVAANPDMEIDYTEENLDGNPGEVIKKTTSFKQFLLQNIDRLSLNNQHGMLKEVFLVLASKEVSEYRQCVFGDNKEYGVLISTYFCNAIKKNHEKLLEVVFEFGIKTLPAPFQQEVLTKGFVAAIESSNYDAGFSIIKYAYDQQITINPKNWILNLDGNTEKLALLFRCFMYFCKTDTLNQPIYLNFFITIIGNIKENIKNKLLNNLIAKMEFFASLDQKTQEILFNYQQVWNNVLLNPVSGLVEQTIKELFNAIYFGSIKDIYDNLAEYFGAQANLEFIFRTLLKNPSCDPAQKIMQEITQDEVGFLIKLLQNEFVLQTMQEQNLIGQAITRSLDKKNDPDMSVALLLFNYACENNITINFDLASKEKLNKFYMCLFQNNYLQNNTNANKFITFLSKNQNDELRQTIMQSCQIIHNLDPKLKKFCFTYASNLANYTDAGLEVINKLNECLGGTLTPNKVSAKVVRELLSKLSIDNADTAVNYLLSPDCDALIAAIIDTNIFDSINIANNRDKLIHILIYLNDDATMKHLLSPRHYDLLKHIKIIDVLDYAAAKRDTMLFIEICKFANIYKIELPALPAPMLQLKAMKNKEDVEKFEDNPQFKHL